MDDAQFLENQQKLLSLCSDVNNVVFALEQYLHISFFRYVKSYANDEKFIVANNEAWLKQYFEEKFYVKELANYYKHPDGSKGMHLHYTCNQDHPACDFWNRNRKIGNYDSVLTFFIKFKEYFEMYDFGILGDEHKTNDTFLNNQAIFRHFFLYFKSRGQTILKAADDCRFPVERLADYDPQKNWLLGHTSNMKKVIISEMPLLEIFLDDEFDHVSLTLTEARSLKFFLEGYGFSQAPQLLSIAEARHTDNLAKVMQKLNVKTYNDLRSMCHQRNIARKLTFMQYDAK